MGRKPDPLPETRTDVQRTFEEKHNADERTTTNRLLGLLFAYAKGSKHITEIGVSNPCTTYALLHALEVGGGGRLVSIDIQRGYPEAIRRVEHEAEKAGLDFAFIECSSLTLRDVEETDFTFIDSLHERDHLLKELDKYAPKTRALIAFHDTEDPCRLLPVVQEWLSSPGGQGWELFRHYRMSPGLTIIRRRTP